MSIDKHFRVRHGLGVNTASENATVEIAANDAILVPRGNSSTDRPSTPANGMFRYNTTSGSFEGYIAGAWTALTDATTASDMETSTYDPAGVSEQLVGLTAIQTLTNKTLTSPSISGASMSGTTTMTGAANVTSGSLSVGVDNSTNGQLHIYGGGTGELGGRIYLYNAADHDTNADYWLISAHDGTGDFIVGNPSATIEGIRIDETTGDTLLARAGSGVVTIGADDTTPGLLHIFGGGVGEIGARIDMYNASDHDTNEEFWRLQAADGSGDFIISGGTSGKQFFRVDETSGLVIIASSDGQVQLGTDDSVAGLLQILGGGTGELGGRIWLYNNADDDTNVQYWNIQAHDGSGDLRIFTSPGSHVNFTMDSSDASTGGQVLLGESNGYVSVGASSSTPGRLIIYGGADTELGARIYMYNATDHDTNEDYWLIQAADASGDFVIGGASNAQGFRIDETTNDVTLNEANGVVRIGAADSVPARLELFGGGTTEAGAIIDLYNNADDDGTTNFWRIVAQDGTGDFVISEDGTRTDFSIDVTGINRLAQGIGTATVGADGTVRGDLSLYGSTSGTGGFLRLYRGTSWDTTYEYNYIDMNNDIMRFGREGQGPDIRILESGDVDIAYQTGVMNVGLNDTTRGLINVYGGGAGELSGEIRIFNNADDDTAPANYYGIYGNDGDGALYIKRDGASAYDLALTTGGVLNLAGNTGTVYVGQNDSVAGNMWLWGGGSGELGGQLRWYIDADVDGGANGEFFRWICDPNANFSLDNNAATVCMYVTPAGQVILAPADGQVYVGAADSVPGNLRIYGGGTGESGGLIQLYNNADDDGTVDYWQIEGNDGTGDFRITTNSGTVMLGFTAASDPRPYGDLALSCTPGGRIAIADDPKGTQDGAGTTLYYSIWTGNRIPLWSGSHWVLHDFGATSLLNTTTNATSNPAATAANTMYDLFVWDDGGTIKFSRGPAWTSSTARGTGAGTTQLQRLDGRWTNQYNITNGPAANRGLYVGSAYTNGSNNWELNLQGSGTGTGRESILFYWNEYNRFPHIMRMDPTNGSYTYNSTSWRTYLGTSQCRFSLISGFGHMSHSHWNTIAATSGTGNRMNMSTGLDSNGADASAQTTRSDGGTAIAAFSTIGAVYVTAGYHQLHPSERSDDTSGAYTGYPADSFFTVATDA